jgi:DNA-binding NtrC family response regulator
MADHVLPFDAAPALVLLASANPSYWHRVREALDDRFAIAYAVDLRGALEILGRHQPAIVLLGARLLDAGLDEALTSLTREHDVEVIVIGGDGREGVCSLKEEQLATALLPTVQQAVVRHRRALEAAPTEKEQEAGEERSVADLGAFREMVVGKNPRAQRQLEVARRVARHDVSVLINGESGTGKEVLARWIHGKSPRAEGPFEAVDLPSTPAELFESVMFGHERGSFTGAVARHEGKFQKARGGTLFLDEIASLRLELQPKLLRALQERVAESVGGSGARTCDVRVIAATNVNLGEAVRCGEFRRDLYYRLCVVTVNLVPLRQRREDIPTFVDFFCKRHAARFQLPVPSVTGEAIAALQRHDWPGNIRELENCVQRAMLLADRPDRLEASDLIGGALGEDVMPEAEADAGSGSGSSDCTRSLAEVEARYIQEVLRHTGGNQSQAAQILQIDRKTLRNKLQKLPPTELTEADESLQSVS